MAVATSNQFPINMPHSLPRLIILICVWTAVVAIHTLFIHLDSGFSFWVSFSDALIFNSLFAAIATGLWHYTSYVNPDNRSTGDLAINHLTVALVTLSIWIYLSILILKWIFGNENIYLLFLDRSVPFRVILGLLFYMTSVWVFYLVRALEKARWQSAREEKISLMLKDAELKALRSQINPHFLFNSLNSIHALTLTDPSRAGEMIINLSDLMRYSLSKQEQMVSFSEEINQVKRYLEIEKIRFSERLGVKIMVAPEAEEIQVPSMILQPLLENAVKHGIYGIEKNVSVSLDAKVTESFLEVRISNNYDTDMPVKKGTGLGLKNVKDRMSVCYHRNDLVEIHKDTDLFTVKLKIPV